MDTFQFSCWAIAQCGIYEIWNCFLHSNFSMPVEMHQCKHTMLKKKIFTFSYIIFFFLKKRNSTLLYSYSHSKKVLHILPITKEVIFWLLIISKINTPKLKIFDLIENCPNITYFGAMYPLHININKLIINLNVILIFLFKWFNFHHLYGFLGVTSTYITY